MAREMKIEEMTIYWHSDGTIEMEPYYSLLINDMPNN